MKNLEGLRSWFWTKIEWFCNWADIPKLHYCPLKYASTSRNMFYHLKENIWGGPLPIMLADRFKVIFLLIILAASRLLPLLLGMKVLKQMTIEFVCKSLRFLSSLTFPQISIGMLKKENPRCNDMLYSKINNRWCHF